MSAGEDEGNFGVGRRLSTGSPSTAEGIEHMRQDLDVDLGAAVMENQACDLKRADHKAENVAVREQSGSDGS